MDLGADTWQTFRFVTFPQLRTALLAAALLAFALSFDEVVVTIFTSGAQQTLPIWIFTNFARPRELPIVNVVALFVIVVVDHPGLDRPANRRRDGLTTDAPGKRRGRSGDRSRAVRSSARGADADADRARDAGAAEAAVAVRVRLEVLLVVVLGVVEGPRLDDLGRDRPVPGAGELLLEHVA